MDKHIEDIKNIREELNWRVKIAYTSNVAFYTIITFLLGFLIRESKSASMTEDANTFVFISTTVVVLISIFAVVLSVNHMVEKKIELYILSLQQKIIEEKIETGTPRFSWISFLYSNVYHSKKNRVNSTECANCRISKWLFKEGCRMCGVKNWFHNFTFMIHGVFQYGFPNFFSLFILSYIIYKINIVDLMWYVNLYILFGFIMFVGSTYVSVSFYFYFLKVKKAHKVFYYKYVYPYFHEKLITREL